MIFDNNWQAFFALIRAGLWEQNTQLLQYNNLNYTTIYHLAEDHAVVGIIAAGLEHVSDSIIPKSILLQFVGTALQIEQRNAVMDRNVGVIVKELNKLGIDPSLVKGQGVAQCYEKPHLRSSGDIDLLLNGIDYYKAKDYFTKSTHNSNHEKKKHQEMRHAEFYIYNCVVELHGTLHPNLSSKMNKAIDEIQDRMFREKKFRIWKLDGVDVMLPEPTTDVVFVFAHILQHFFESGIGLRQICDLCRLLWKYKEEIDATVLEVYLKSMGVITEWKAFASLMVDFLGFPKTMMPLYDSLYTRKGKMVMSFVMESGNFGRNLDYSYTKRHKRVIRKVITVSRQLWWALRRATVFPVDAIRFYLYFVKIGVVSVMNGD